MLYALGVGATELPFIYERNLKVLPTFAVIPAFPALMGMTAAVEVNLVMLLHGEQSFQIKKTIPVKGKLTTAGTVTGVYDKGKGALITIDSATKDDERRDRVHEHLGRLHPGSPAASAASAGRRPATSRRTARPTRPWRCTTLAIQAAIYRLSGDRNPLHIDPDFAKMAGYDRPILHGLCSFGHVGRAVLSEYCGNDPERFVGMSVRFSGVVYPGDTITTEMWDEGNGKIVVQAKTQEGRVVISNAAVQVK